jgi:hypothetical protein
MQLQLKPIAFPFSTHLPHLDEQSRQRLAELEDENQLVHVCLGLSWLHFSERPPAATEKPAVLPPAPQSPPSACDEVVAGHQEVRHVTARRCNMSRIDFWSQQPSCMSFRTPGHTLLIVCNCYLFSLRLPG